jgi:hypothetical protein
MIRVCVAAASLGVLASCASRSPGACTIAASDYDQTCSVDDDCTGVFSGDLCTASCTDCTGGAISNKAQAEYDADLAKKSYEPRICPCAFQAVSCRNGTCVVGGSDGGLP